MLIEDTPQIETTLIGMPALMTTAFTGGDLTPIGDALMERIQNNSDDANALLDMSTLFILRGDNKLARSMQNFAIQVNPLFHYPRPDLPIKIRALAILGPGNLMANSPFEFLIENQPVALDLLYITPEQTLPREIPDHDVLIVAIGESDVNLPLLDYLDQALQDWPRPVINRPGYISQLARDTTCAQLADIAEIAMPPTGRVSRDSLEQCCRTKEDINYPFIIRPIDSHAGSGLSKIESADDLTGYLQNSIENIFFVSPFIDYRSADGLFRKYRIILIGGVPYACHLAISTRWMVHYLNADMLENAEHRAEEAEFMRTFDADFALRHANAFKAIHTQSGLDYVGIDCAETPDGRLLVFEIDSNMVVHNMDSAQKFPYKKIQMPKIFSAFTNLLAKRCGVSL